MRSLEEVKCTSNASQARVPTDCEIGELPMWLVTVYLAGNTALSVLNFFWFSQMIKAVRKRFSPRSNVKGSEDAKKAQ